MIPGVPNPWLIIGLAAAWLASLAGVGWWQRTDGAAAERIEWQQRENTELRLANQKVVSLARALRAAEHAHGEAVAAIATHYEKELQHAQDQRERDRAAVRTGGLRLRDPHPAGLRACGNAAAAPGAAAGLGDDRAAGELSAAASEFLYDLANDADAVAHQLAACQRVVIEDRRDHLPDAGKMVE